MFGKSVVEQKEVKLNPEYSVIDVSWHSPERYEFVLAKRSRVLGDAAIDLYTVYMECAFQSPPG